MSESHLRLCALSLRKQLESHFAADTAAGGWANDAVPSAGHCAAVSAIVAHGAVGIEGVPVDCVSATVDGGSHWFNRLTVDGVAYDVDVTGDQFGRPPVQVAPAGTLYEGTRLREYGQLNRETLARAAVLAQRAGFRYAIVPALAAGQAPRR